MSSNLVDTFMRFISSQDRDILQQALNDFTSVDSDELLEVLANYKCRTRVTAETLRDILVEIAHKQLVQKPMFVIDCWKEVVMLNLTPLTHDELLRIFHNYKPTPKKVVGLLQFPVLMTSNQREVQNHLKRYIRELL